MPKRITFQMATIRFEIVLTCPDVCEDRRVGCRVIVSRFDPVSDLRTPLDHTYKKCTRIYTHPISCCCTRASDTGQCSCTVHPDSLLACHLHGYSCRGRGRWSRNTAFLCSKSSRPDIERRLHRLWSCRSLRSHRGSSIVHVPFPIALRCKECR